MVRLCIRLVTQMSRPSPYAGSVTTPPLASKMKESTVARLSAQSDWADRAVLSWRQQCLKEKLSELIGVDLPLGQISVAARTNVVEAVVDGVAFRLLPESTDLHMECRCRGCHKPAHFSVATMADVGHALDSLCANCQFLATSSVGIRAR